MINSTIKFLFSLCITLILSGCFSFNTVPKDNAEFAAIEHLSDLDGIYQNQGEGESGPAPYYLSTLIWPKEKIAPKTFMTIEVKAINETTIQIKGKGWADTVVKERILIEGKDFDLHSGRIILRKQIGVSGFQSGEVIVGPYSNNSELGLDQQGHGKLKDSSFVRSEERRVGKECRSRWSPYH